MPIWLRRQTSHSSTPPSSAETVTAAPVPSRRDQKGRGEAPDAHAQYRPIGKLQQARPGAAIQREMAIHHAPDTARRARHEGHAGTASWFAPDPPSVASRGCLARSAGRGRYRGTLPPDRRGHSGPADPAGLPRSTTRPCFSIRTCEHSRSTSAMLWLASRIVQPVSARYRSSQLRTRSPVSGSRLAVGSSSSSSSGRLISDFASATRVF